MKPISVLTLLVIALGTFSTTAVSGNPVVKDIWWSSINQPFASETETIVTAAFKRVDRQFEISSNVDIRFRGFIDKPLAHGLDECLGGFAKDPDYQALHSDSLTGSAFAILGGADRTGLCLTVFKEPRRDEKGNLQHLFTADLLLHEVGHLFGMPHPFESPLLPVVDLRYNAIPVMSALSPVFTIHDRVHLARTGRHVDPANPKVIPAEAFLSLEPHGYQRATRAHYRGNADYGYLQLYLPVVDLKEWGVGDAWFMLDYEGLVNGKHRWQFDPVRLISFVDNKIVEKYDFTYGFLKDLVPDHNTYTWRNPARLTADGALVIPVIAHAYGQYENVVLRVPDMSIPVNDWRFVLESVDGSPAQ